MNCTVAAQNGQKKVAAKLTVRKKRKVLMLLGGRTYVVKVGH